MCKLKYLHLSLRPCNQSNAWIVWSILKFDIICDVFATRFGCSVWQAHWWAQPSRGEQAPPGLEAWGWHFTDPCRSQHIGRVQPRAINNQVSTNRDTLETLGTPWSPWDVQSWPWLRTRSPLTRWQSWLRPIPYCPCYRYICYRRGWGHFICSWGVVLKS